MRSPPGPGCYRQQTQARHSACGRIDRPEIQWKCGSTRPRLSWNQELLAGRLTGGRSFEDLALLVSIRDPLDPGKDAGRRFIRSPRQCPPMPMHRIPRLSLAPPKSSCSASRSSLRPPSTPLASRPSRRSPSERSSRPGIARQGPDVGPAGFASSSVRSSPLARETSASWPEDPPTASPSALLGHARDEPSPPRNPSVRRGGDAGDSLIHRPDAGQSSPKCWESPYDYPHSLRLHIPVDVGSENPKPNHGPPGNLRMVLSERGRKLSGGLADHLQVPNCRVQDPRRIGVPSLLRRRMFDDAGDPFQDVGEPCPVAPHRVTASSTACGRTSQ